MAERSVTVGAPAKINLVLRVLGRREDGYHDLESLVLPVSLQDSVTAREAEAMSVAMFHPDGRPMLLPDPESNLAFRAATAWLRARARDDLAAAIEVEKHIPMAAGLGGGSADAAAVLEALDALWNEGLPEGELDRLAAELGSDVPAMLHGGPAVMRGRGELVEPVDAATTWWVLLPQPFAVRTPHAYAWWDEVGSTAPADVGRAVAALHAGDLDALAALLHNDLQGPVARRHAQVQVGVERLLDAGALGAVMSGSGPTVAALVADEQEAIRVSGHVPRAIPVVAPPPPPATTSAPG
ncbi:MAG: 4-(cytidine 5'-diphospho)-2-C-methyl-D-erythritol kinase [Actinomycetota bacterium]